MSELHGAFGRTLQAMMGDRTAGELAERAGVSNSYLKSVLRGNIPSRPVVIALARACDLGREGASHLLRLAGYNALQEHEWAPRKASTAAPDPSFSLPEPGIAGSAWLALEGPSDDSTAERRAPLPPALGEGAPLPAIDDADLSFPALPRLLEGDKG